jgi:quercetin dioxygenase-like cupin family protein
MIEPRLRASVVAMAGATLLLAAHSRHASAAEVPPEAIATPLLAQKLTGIPGKEAVMITVEYPPGGASQPHRHDAHVFVYMLQGRLLMQADGRAPVTLEPGQTFYESPDDVHRMSANASATEPAKFLVLMVKDEGRPTTRPVTAP